MVLLERVLRSAVGMSRRIVGLPLVVERLTQMENRLESVSCELTRVMSLEAESVAKLERISALERARLDDRIAQSAMDRPLAFMHIPKTSGTALTVSLCDVLPSTAYIAGIDLSMFGSFRSFETVAPELQRKIYTGALPPSNGADFVAGHFAYSTLAKYRPNARFMTVLREPRSRVLSQWMYWRSHTDEALQAWGAGAWSAVLRLAREPLARFLSYPEAACHTDNIAVRMLLWPHPLVPDDGFIDEAADQRLVDEAAARLESFHLADIYENPQLEENLRTLLARPFVYRRANETNMPPPELRVPLQDELASNAMLLIEHRSRLDRRLWLQLAGKRLAGSEPAKLADDTFHRSVARYTALMTP
jgi:hypothetical protein